MLWNKYSHIVLSSVTVARSYRLHRYNIVCFFGSTLLLFIRFLLRLTWVRSDFLEVSKNSEQKSRLKYENKCNKICNIRNRCDRYKSWLLSISCHHSLVFRSKLANYQVTGELIPSQIYLDLLYHATASRDTLSLLLKSTWDLMNNEFKQIIIDFEGIFLLVMQASFAGIHYLSVFYSYALPSRIKRPVATVIFNQFLHSLLFFNIVRLMLICIFESLGLLLKRHHFKKVSNGNIFIGYSLPYG